MRLANTIYFFILYNFWTTFNTTRHVFINNFMDKNIFIYVLRASMLEVNKHFLYKRRSRKITFSKYLTRYIKTWRVLASCERLLHTHFQCESHAYLINMWSLECLHLLNNFTCCYSTFHLVSSFLIHSLIHRLENKNCNDNLLTFSHEYEFSFFRLISSCNESPWDMTQLRYFTHFYQFYHINQ